MTTISKLEDLETTTKKHDPRLSTEEVNKNLYDGNDSSIKSDIISIIWKNLSVSHIEALYR